MSQQQIIVKPRPTNIVRKADKLVRARYSLSAIAIKVITSVIAMIDKNDADFKLYVIKVQDFKELIDTKGKLGGSAYQQLIDACNELMNKKIEFIEGIDIGFMLTRWIASAEYFAGAGEIEIEISQKLRPLLLQLKEGNYLNYELRNILALKSGYVIRLYELLKHEYNKVARYKGHTTATYEINIDEFRNDFKIPDSYRYDNIKTQIFNKAAKEFKEYTDIDITYEPSRKKGKKVVAVEFTIRENTHEEPHLKDLKTFIKHVRKYCINQDIWVGQNMILSVSPKGRIYDKKTTREYNKNDSQKVWENWYELAKENKLMCLKQGTLF